MGIIPDKFILLNQSDEETLDGVMRNLNGETENKPGINVVADPEQRERLARNAMLEYNLKLRGVKNICQGFVTELESN